MVSGRRQKVGNTNFAHACRLAAAPSAPSTPSLFLSLFLGHTLSLMLMLRHAK